MKTVILGSGNVAHHLANAFAKNGTPIAQIFGRNAEALSEISALLNIPYSVDNLEDADFYLICVSDSSIEEVSSQIKKENCLVAHTSGSVSRDTLVGNYRKSVFYPLQTFSKFNEINYSEMPIFIDTENKEDDSILFDLAHKITEKVHAADDLKRRYIHVTAVFACNFVNHLYARAKEISDSQDLPFSYFLPLIDETCRKIHFMAPKMAQTGPAVRKDEKVLQKHEALLKDPQLLTIYKTLNESIKKMYEL